MKFMWTIQQTGQNTNLNIIEDNVKAKIKEMGIKMKDVVTVNAYFQPETLDTYYVVELTDGKILEEKL